MVIRPCGFFVVCFIISAHLHTRLLIFYLLDFSLIYHFLVFFSLLINSYRAFIPFHHTTLPHSIFPPPHHVTTLFLHHTTWIIFFTTTLQYTPFLSTTLLHIASITSTPHHIFPSLFHHTTSRHFHPPPSFSITPQRGQKVVIAAHGNSLRALVKYLDNMSDADIMALNIPTGGCGCSGGCGGCNCG